jgi:hypothetical protein
VPRHRHQPRLVGMGQLRVTASLPVDLPATASKGTK